MPCPCLCGGNRRFYETCPNKDPASRWAGLIVGAGFIVFRRIRAWRETDNSIKRAARPILQLSASAMIAAIAAFYAAGFAFQRVFSSYNNHDSAGPFLIAAPVAFVVFMLVWPVGFALIFMVLEWILKAFQRRP